MANEEHLKLSQYIKDVHSVLRKNTLIKGEEAAWKEHCDDKKTLKQYASFMQQLAISYWDINSEKECTNAVSRIKWAADYCYDYFVNKTYVKYADKENEIAIKTQHNITENIELFTPPIKLLDVGSCYNPFKDYEFLEVCAIDLCPANKFVKKCDFLNVNLLDKLDVIGNEIICLEKSSFDVITFCFLIEYIPTSELRIKACKNAYELIKPGGLLLISTPDSKHVGANSKLIKNWRYTLAHLGFTRIKYEKLPHMHCMAFRKVFNKPIAIRWAEIQKEQYEMAIHIPQDFNNITLNSEEYRPDFITFEVAKEDFLEMPFCNDHCLDFCK